MLNRVPVFRFQSLLTDEQVSDAPILILGNKIDRPGAISEDELRSVFGLHGQTTGKVRITLLDSERICFRWRLPFSLSLVRERYKERISSDGRSKFSCVLFSRDKVTEKVCDRVI